MKKEKQQRSYLTKAEALNFGEFLHSDFRRLLKQRESRFKAKENIICFIPWTISIRQVTKEDMNIWHLLYHEHGVRNFNDIEPILKIWLTVDINKSIDNEIEKSLQ